MEDGQKFLGGAPPKPPSTMFVPRSTRRRTLQLQGNRLSSAQLARRSTIATNSAGPSAGVFSNTSQQDQQVAISKHSTGKPQNLAESNTDARGPSKKSRFHEDHPPTSTKSKPKPAFAFGNYDQYYGYRNASQSRIDPRLLLFQRQWFEGKRVLDVGCNAGFITINIAMLFRPRWIEGVDIDPGLVRKAQSYLGFRYSLLGEKGVKNRRRAELEDGEEENSVVDSHMDDVEVEDEGNEDDDDMEYFLISCPLSLGQMPIVQQTCVQVQKPSKSCTFPFNVHFRCGDWVHEPQPPLDESFDINETKYDVILGLSITKWIHLNWGDAGIKRFFQKCFDCLSPSGLLVLEPQLWDSYARRSKMTKEMRKNHAEIRLTPDQFRTYLLDEVGFKRVMVLGESANKAKGFERPLFIYEK
ncbi:hypothetical protein HK102_002150 [Quaeritorhiza haematococci]|nr:hypothetical protein HK102_002150 [Quaeritorhiza haematococci]